MGNVISKESAFVNLDIMAMIAPTKFALDLVLARVSVSTINVCALKDTKVKIALEVRYLFFHDAKMFL